MTLRFKNNATSRLYADVLVGDLTIRVQSGDGAKFPALSPGDLFIVTVEDRRTGQTEIMNCTSITGDVLTVTRAQEGTVAQAFTMGATVSNRFTAATIDFILANVGYSTAEADAKFVDVAGDIMTGPLVLPNVDPAAGNEAARKAYVDAQVAPKIADAPSNANSYGRMGGAWVTVVNAATYTAGDVLAKLLTVDGSGSGLDADFLDGLSSAAFALASDLAVTNGNVAANTAALATKLNTSAYTAADVLTKLLTVDGAGSGLDADLLDGLDSAFFAPIGSPTFTGDPKAPTPATADSDTSIATTAFVKAQGYIADAPGGASAYVRLNNAWVVGYDKTTIDTAFAPKASPALTGNPTAPTPAGGDNDTSIATTAFVTAAIAAMPPPAAGTSISDAAPGSPTAGQLWWESDSGALYIYYNDGNTSQWVQVNGVPPTVPVPAAETRNRIVNPAMQVSQENGNGTGTVTGYYAADMWPYYWIASGAAIAHLRAGGSTPKGSLYRLRINVNTPKASLAAADYLQWLHAIEGVNIVDFLWGTVAARPIILRFGIKIAAGTYAINIRNGALTRCYTKTFTISAGQANLDTEIVMAIPGDTTGVWNVDNSVGLYFTIAIAAGTSQVAGVQGWSAGGFVGFTGQTNGIGSAQSIELFDVGIYLDPNNTGVEPAWQFPDEALELVKCQRYWQQVALYWCGSVTSLSGFYTATTFQVAGRPGATVSGVNLGNGGFAATVGVLNTFSNVSGVYSVRETRTATATGAAQLWGTTITLNGRM